MSSASIRKLQGISYGAMAVLLGMAAPASAQDSQAAAPASDIYSGLEGTVFYYDVSGGVNSEARGETIFRRFTDLSGVAVQADYNADTTKFFATMEAGAPPPWSLIEFATVGEFNRAKTLGYLEPLDPSVVPLDRLVEGAADEYGIQAMKYAAVLAWNTDKWPVSGEHPATWADLYDLEKFPGKRCLFDYPQYGGTLESALLADGVSSDALYPLDTARAFTKLDTIKDEVVWWSSGAEAIQYLTTGECDLGIVWSPRVGAAVNDEGAPLDLSWDQAIYTTAVWAIPKGTANMKAAQAAVAHWVLDKEGQIEFVTRFPLPTGIVGIELADYPESVQSYLPEGDNLKTAILEDAAYYEQNLPTVVEEFNAWMQ